MVDVIVVDIAAVAEARLLHCDSAKRYQSARSEPFPAQFVPADVGCDGG